MGQGRGKENGIVFHYETMNWMRAALRYYPILWMKSIDKIICENYLWGSRVRPKLSAPEKLSLCFR